MPPERGPRKQAAPERVPVRVPVALPITVGQFLKVAQLAGSGGEAKMLIADGLVTVNGEVERRRGHKLAAGDVVRVQDAAAQVAETPGP